jgi:N-acetylneuraminate synthase/N,N'-diacetyllegionaminate synthase
MFQLDGRAIGGGRCFVIAEAGVNHNGDAGMAHRLIDAAAGAGVDAIKFQTFIPALLASSAAGTAAYQARGTTETTQLGMLERLTLPREAYSALAAHAAERGLVFLSTPFDNESVDFLDALGVAAFKLSSGDLTNALLLRHVAGKGKPLLLSSGMATLDEVRAAIAEVTARAEVPIAVLHCVSSYPASLADCNLRAIPAMAAALRIPVGFSDHTTGHEAALAAVALGAAVIEKHLTLDRRLDGPDHQASAEPLELQQLVEAMRGVESALGDGDKRPTAAEAEAAILGRRSLHWRRALTSGAVIDEDDLIALRPATGIAPDRWRTIVGRRVTRDVAAGAIVEPDEVA